MARRNNVNNAAALVAGQAGRAAAVVPAANLVAGQAGNAALVDGAAGLLAGLTVPERIGDAVSIGEDPPAPPAEPDPMALLLEQQRQFQAQQQEQSRQAASAWLRQTLGNYGLGDLAGDVDGLILEWGTNTDVIALKLRETQTYKDRFKGLIALQQRGITDITNEAQYIQMESEYRRAFRDTGLSDFLGEAGSAGERDSIADLVGKYSVSVNEVRDRISDAQRVIGQDTPQEVKDAWALYYGVDASQLVRYVLDPERTSQQINRQANAAMVGGLSAKAGIGTGVGAAGRVADLFGDGDANVGQISQQLQGARTIADATKRLAAIDQIDLSNDEIVDTAFGTDAGAEKKVKGLQSRERARFGGSGAFGRGSLGRGTGT